MQELLVDNPWLAVVGLAMLVPLTAIVFGTITGYLIKTRQAELDAALKQEMLQRGMSAEEIQMVLAASSKPPRRSRCHAREVSRHVG
jgi:hypothetical protein